MPQFVYFVISSLTPSNILFHVRVSSRILMSVSVSPLLTLVRVDSAWCPWTSCPPPSRRSRPRCAACPPYRLSAGPPGWSSSVHGPSPGRANSKCVPSAGASAVSDVYYLCRYKPCEGSGQRLLPHVKNRPPPISPADCKRQQKGAKK